jgi:DNA invertase Pin-like site-specific DNA recombinase
MARSRTASPDPALQAMRERRRRLLAEGPHRRALYARVSMRDSDQDPELQLQPMRQHAALQGCDTVEYVDRAQASDLAGRIDWRELLGDARARSIDHVEVWKLDRAFRSCLHALSTLEELDRLGVGFSCTTQAIDTTTPTGRLTLAILAAVAEFERALIRERVREGLVNARRKGSRLGRSPVTDRPGFAEAWIALRPKLEAGSLSHREAARRLEIGVATLQRLLQRVPPNARLGTLQRLFESAPKTGGRPKRVGAPTRARTASVPQTQATV